MPPPILVAGLDWRSLLLEAPMLQRDNHVVKEVVSGRELLEDIGPSGARLVVLGPKLPDLNLAHAVRRIRVFDATRHVSILILVPAGDDPHLESELVDAGANAVLRRPLEQAVLEAWLARLLVVPRRVEARVPVQAQVVGSPRSGGSGHFYGLTRNLSINGMLLASPVPLEGTPDLDLEFTLPGTTTRLKVMARVVREAGDVEWPYRGYGIEFIFLPPTTLEAIEDLIAHSDAQVNYRSPDSSHGIHSTVRRDDWVYEILQPIRRQERWQTEIRRAPRDGWRPGSAGPYYVVEGDSLEAALKQARAFLDRVP